MTAPGTELDRVATPCLPGLAEYELPVPLPEAQLKALPVFTAERLLTTDPERYARAVALFFGAGLSQRMVCQLERLSPHTIQAIIMRESRGAVAARWSEAMRGNVRALLTMSMSVAQDMLADPKQCKSAGMRGVAALMRELRESLAVLDGRSPQPRPHSEDDPLEAGREYLRQMARAQSVTVSQAPTERVQADENEAPRAMDEVPTDGGSDGRAEDVETCQQ